jgi:S-(hydroxymethyl)glutathione dehydrogenase/alcohol dehydrogenase
MGIGGFAEQTLLHETALVKIDPAMPLDRAALIGCGVLTGYGAATNAARVEEGWEVAVFGCGGVGLNIIQGAKARGAGSIVAIDLDDAKLERARAFGATHVLRADAPKLHKAIRDLTFEKQGVDCAFDAVGSVEVAAIAYRSICKGGVVTLVGIDRMERTFPVSSFQSVLQEKRIQGSLGGSADNYQQVRDLIRLYQSGDLKLDELLTRRYRLNEVNEAMDDLRNGKNARGVIVLE